MLPIKLHASLGNYAAFSARKASKTFRAVAQKVFNRDNYTCQFCSFQARDFQEVVNHDNNYQNNRLSNLKTACCFCAQCFFLESLGEKGYGGGTLLYLPEISQNELNTLCHVLFCAMVNDTAYKETAQSIYRTLRMRNQLIEEQLGEGVSEPAVFGQLLLDYEQTQQKSATAILENLRILPARGRFQRQVERWAEAAMAEME